MLHNSSLEAAWPRLTSVHQLVAKRPFLLACWRLRECYSLLKQVKPLVQTSRLTQWRGGSGRLRRPAEEQSRAETCGTYRTPSLPREGRGGTHPQWPGARRAAVAQLRGGSQSKSWELQGTKAPVPTLSGH